MKNIASIKNGYRNTALTQGVFMKFIMSIVKEFFRFISDYVRNNAIKISTPQ